MSANGRTAIEEIAFAAEDAAAGASARAPESGATN
jgi:hypothetical protein